MGWVRTIIDEIIALFVDDVSLVAAILVWLVLMFAGVRLHLVAGDVAGPILFAGLAAIFIENTLRRARK
jgi:hypothetical protein